MFLNNLTSNNVNSLILFIYYFYLNAVTIKLYLKSYCNINGNINLFDYKKIICQIKNLHYIINNCKYNKKCKYPSSQYNLQLNEIVFIIAQV